MCGIVGIVGKSAVAPQLVDALKRLEYRGMIQLEWQRLMAESSNVVVRKANCSILKVDCKKIRLTEISVLATRAGQRMVRRPSKMPIHISPKV